MKKKEHSVNIPTIEEVENEQKRLRHRAVYQRTLRGTIAVLLVVAAISVLVATLWMPVLQIYGSSMSPTLEARADCSISEDQSVKNRRGGCILARK